MSMGNYSRVDTLVRDLEQLLESGHRADLAFFIGPKKKRLNAHSTIVAARCRRLKANISSFVSMKREKSTLSQSKSNLDEQNDVLEFFYLDHEPIVMASVLRYMYTGKIVLNTENTFDVYKIAEDFGIPRLLELVSHHLDVCTDVHHVLALLHTALSHGFRKLAVRLTEYAADNCATILRTKSVEQASAIVLQQLILQEDLNASEDEIWDGLVRWACARCSIMPAKRVSAMSGLERQKVVEHLMPFMRPGKLRILNFDASTFALEVEPLGVISTEELMLKYRFDAAKDVVGFDSAFPGSWIQFLTRTRRRMFVFESVHPHACGVNSKVAVRLPSWSTKVRIEFDPRCELGQYAELTFFQDEACSTMLSILTDTRRERWNGHMPQLSISKGLSLQLPSSHFWFTFYSPRNFASRWGFKFSVHTI